MYYTVANNPQLAAQIQQQQQRLMAQAQRQHQQQQALMAQGMYGNMAANGMQMPMNQMGQMNAAQFAAMRSNAMRPVGLPQHLSQAHLTQHGQHQGANPSQQAVSSPTRDCSQALNSVLTRVSFHRR